MLAVDLVAGVVIAAAVVWGLRQGFTAALPLAAFAVGAVLGTRAPLLVGEELQSPSALLIALPAALLLGALLAGLAERLGGRLWRDPVPGRAGAVVSAVAGGILAGSLGVAAVWILAGVATEVKSVRERVEDSSVLARLNSVLEPAGPAAGVEQARADELPRFAFARPDVAAPDPRAQTDPDVRAAVRGVVKVGVGGCGRAGIGSGWLAADGIAVTNAHVINRARTILVRLSGTGPRRPATPIWFDRRNDLALLRIPALRGVPALPIVGRPRSGTSAASIGFPGTRRRIHRARLGPTSSRLEGEIDSELPGFTRKTYGRLITTFRGRVRPGSSGGPIVDRRGRVLTTAAATANFGAIGVPNRLVRAALRQAGPPVRPGRCPTDRGSTGAPGQGESPRPAPPRDRM